MKIINYISTISIPIIIFIIVLKSFLEKNNVFDLFLEGAGEGLKTVYKIFPTLVGLFVAVGALRSSGLIDFLTGIIYPFVEIMKIPKEIMPLGLLRPISGSASVAVATDIMNNYGVDSQIGRIASVIMGSTETTLYTLAIYTSCIKVKNTRGIIWAAIAGDVICVIVATWICNFL